MPDTPSDAPPPPPPEDAPHPAHRADDVPAYEPEETYVPEGPVATAATIEEEVIAEEEGRGEPEDRFRTLVAIGIAIVSILGAIVAFTGTLANQDGSQLDQTGIEDTSTQQQIITNLSATVEEDERNLAPYNEEVKAAAILQSQAATLQSTDPTAAGLLQAQAQSYLVLARERSGFFQGSVPSPGPSNKPVQYDPKQALTLLENRDSELSQLKPEATLAQADAKHTQSVNLVGLVTLFIAALLFLTLAQFTRPAIRRVFAGAGALTAVIAVVLWILVLVLGS